MTERDYILTTSLARVMDAEDCLRHLDEYPEIPLAELAKVRAMLRSWRERLNRTITERMQRHHHP